jgi:hypothetical protein
MEMMLEGQNGSGSIIRVQKRIPHNTQSLSFETIYIKKLSITTCRYELSCCLCCFIIPRIKAHNCIEQINCICYRPADGPVISSQSKFISLTSAQISAHPHFCMLLFTAAKNITIKGYFCIWCYKNMIITMPSTIEGA